jgi:hypothetical protein
MFFQNGISNFNFCVALVSESFKQLIQSNGGIDVVLFQYDA